MAGTPTLKSQIHAPKKKKKEKKEKKKNKKHFSDALTVFLAFLCVAA